MKKLLITLKGEWVLQHRTDGVLPIEKLKNEIAKLNYFRIGDSTLTGLSLFYEDSVPEEELKKAVGEVFTKTYPGEDGVMSFEFSDCDREEQKIRTGSTGAKPEEAPKRADDGKKAEGVMERIDGLVGAAEFKSLARETKEVASEIVKRKSFSVFNERCYLFSIGDGCGTTTYLRLFAELLSAVGLRNINAESIKEFTLGPYSEDMKAFGAILEDYEDTQYSQKSRIVAIDISEWMDKTNNAYFKKFLKIVSKTVVRDVVVFRIPFVDKDVLARIRYSLNDMLSVIPVTFPPFSQEEMKRNAENEFKEFGYAVENDAWDYFFDRISEEKSDGKFYGLNTVKKVVREAVYKKQLAAARGSTPENVTAEDLKAICSSASGSGLSGMEQLKRLVGNEHIKKRVEEIIAQVELSRKNAEKSPCIHMRFVGNPGTGKTTVARIIGKIFKERGVLRVGAFFEYAGRDLCGRYIGETAPKTASICRDAYGSVLFIDEAYSLYRGDGDSRDYGREALDTLIAEMENHRDDFIVIMAGYTDDMNKLMEGNHGLASRMPYTIEFPNFTRDELFEIFKSMVKDGFLYEEDMLSAAKTYFSTLSEEFINSKSFSNGRFVRNLFERTWAKAAMRCQLNKAENIVLTKDDFECAGAEKDFAFTEKKKNIIGF